MSCALAPAVLHRASAKGRRKRTQDSGEFAHVQLTCEHAGRAREQPAPLVDVHMS